MTASEHEHVVIGIRRKDYWQPLFNRIEAHVCICFVAYTIMLELERILKVAESHITLEKVRFLAEKIYQINYVNPYDNKRKSVLLHTREEPADGCPLPFAP